MKIKSRVPKFQQGGMTPTAAGDEAAMQPSSVPVDQAGNSAAGQEMDPIMQLVQLAQQALQTGDGQLALQVCEGFLALVQAMASDAGSSQEAPQGEPIFKAGGKIVRRV